MLGSEKICLHPMAGHLKTAPNHHMFTVITQLHNSYDPHAALRLFTFSHRLYPCTTN
jgi:hypothetical protein